jgi:TPP-dependent pyruvate/acetoin dehydrogenase alpha subunit
VGCARSAAAFPAVPENQGSSWRGGLDRIEADVESQIQQAVEKAEKWMAQSHDPLEMFDHLYAEPPDVLKQHRRELADELESAAKESGHG